MKRRRNLSAGDSVSRRALGRAALLLTALLLTALLHCAALAENAPVADFLDKAERIRRQALSEEVVQAIGERPAGEAGWAVFFSVCDGQSRARVYSATGDSLTAAWDAAVDRTAEALGSDAVTPRWVKADIVTGSKSISRKALKNQLNRATPGFYFKGIALDPHFENALLEGELNGAGIYNYEKDRIHLKHMNRYLDTKGIAPLDKRPDPTIVFDARGWLCDAEGAVYPLIAEGADYGRREIAPLDADRAREMIVKATAYLKAQVMADGRFIYGLYPQFDEAVDGYSVLRHSGTLWAMACGWRLAPDDDLRAAIERGIDWLLGQLVYDDSGAAYVPDGVKDELKLGGNGLTVLALTEIMDAFDDQRYLEACRALGEGMLNMQDPETGRYCHVYNRDFTLKDEQRTVFYDGEATFALARLYGLTGERRWLDAAIRAVERFIREDYTQYKDHWVAYSLNEVTKYVDDRPEFYDFALKNFTENRDRIEGKARSTPTNLELLCSCFETWRRMTERGADTGDFDIEGLVNAIYGRVQRQASGFFFPEYAMYMENPGRMLDAFYMRTDRFRVRIDDVQHNIGGYYLYWKNWDALLKAGMGVR